MTTFSIYLNIFSNSEATLWQLFACCQIWRAINVGCT